MSCWADSNRRPHPYQEIKCSPDVAAQGVVGIFTAKRMRSETLCPMCSVRSFPRVGHGVGQSHRHRRCGSTFSGRGMVAFCAAGNNERVSKRRHRATGRDPPARWPCSFWLCFPYGGANAGHAEKAERVFWGIPEFSSCCFVQVTRVIASTKSALFCCCVIVGAKLLANIKQNSV